MSSGKANWRPEIEGLRAVAVLAVLSFHAFPNALAGGFVGVDIFFVISGYLISFNIFADLESKSFSFIQFFKRRILRLLPALLAVLAAVIIFGWLTLYPDEFKQLGKHIASSSIFILNYTLDGEVGYFDNIAETKPLLHLWSLAVEEQFYIIWPLIVWLVYKLKMDSLGLLITLWTASLVLTLIPSDEANHSFFHTSTRAWELLTGAMLAKFHMQTAKRRFTLDLSSNNLSRINGEILGIVGACAIVLSCIYFDSSPRWPSALTLVPIAGTVAIIIAAQQSAVNRLLLSCSPVRLIGRISYPLYLWHWPILSFLVITLGSSDLDYRVRLLALSASFVLAYLSYRFLELPFRYQFNHRHGPVALLFCLSLAGMAGFYIFVSEGETRHNLKMRYISEAAGDWEYADGLIKSTIAGDTYFSTSTHPPEVIFFGDSHIEQYAPRVVDLYRKGVAKETAFITYGGCPPIPNVLEDLHLGCEAMFLRLESLLATGSVKAVVIGGAFNSYLARIHPKTAKYTYYFKDEQTGEEFPFYEETGIQRSMDALRNFAVSLTTEFDTVLLLDIPTGANFDPKSLTLVNGKRSIPLSFGIKSDSFPQSVDEIALSNTMKQLFAQTDVTLIDQAARICPSNACKPMTEDGKPIYKDTNHMRPFYVREYMNLLDTWIRKSP